jgi:hypothetical protein
MSDMFSNISVLVSFNTVDSGLSARQRHTGLSVLFGKNTYFYYYYYFLT